MNNGGKFQRGVVAVLTVLVVVALPPSPVGSVSVDGGACVVSINVTSSSMPLVPGLHTWTVSSGGGTCTTAQGDFPATVGGSLNPPQGTLPTVGCAAAVMQGDVTLTITGGTYGAITLKTVGVVVGAVVVLAGVRVADMVATAVLVQDTASTVGCLDDLAITSATWWGALVFVDPVLGV